MADAEAKPKEMSFETFFLSIYFWLSFATKMNRIGGSEVSGARNDRHELEAAGQLARWPSRTPELHHVRTKSAARSG